MCGFVGRIIKDFEDSSNTLPALNSGLKFFERRGPDSTHEWQSSDKRVELIQARLAIVDQHSRADLPFSDESCGVTAIFNGEIYNYEELRRELSDYSFRTYSDTEVLVAVLALWGTKGFTRLRGMFACVLVDSRQRRVFLARDPVGKKPLFIAQWPDCVVFGSSVLSMVAATGTDTKLRAELLSHFFDRGYVPPNTSIVHGVRPLAPGEILELDWDGAIVAQTSCVPAVSSSQGISLSEAQSEVGRLLKLSVQRRMHNNPKPVSLLSGGIDSTAVTTTMHAVGGGAAITLGALLPFLQDEKYARYVAWRESIPLEILRMRIARFADDAAAAFELQDEPLGMMSFFVLAQLLRVAQSYGKILLTGDGGDEVFFGYGRPEDWANGENGMGEFTDEEQSVVVGVPPPAWLSPWARFTVGHSLLGHMFPKLDRASAEQGVEVRCPLLDWDLIAFVRSLPFEYMSAGGRSKSLLLGQLKGWPRWFLNRKKVGFAYHLRWAWGMRRFAGLRELVIDEAVVAFESQLAPGLRKAPKDWSSLIVFRQFASVWRLLAWSAFLKRFKAAQAIAARNSKQPIC